MTDRDYFAAAALAGLMANPNNNDTTADAIRFWAWNWADAMLRERERVTEPLLKEKQAEVSVAPVSRPPETRASFSATNHGAAPAARVSERECTTPAGAGGIQNDAVPAADGEGTRHEEGSRVRASATPTGNTREPVAWAVMLADNHRIWGVYALEEEANAINDVVAGGHGVVPLYRQPALTAEECEAIELAAYDYLYHQDWGGRAQWIREQLLGLLARTGGTNG
jgi:hypothetical protein